MGKLGWGTGTVVGTAWGTGWHHGTTVEPAGAGLAHPCPLPAGSVLSLT